MKAFFEILRLEWRRLARQHTVEILLAVCGFWMLLLLRVLKSDGTVEGARTLFIQFSLGGAFAICCVALAAAGALSLSREREEHRLALAKVRPAPRISLALGRMAALTLCGALALAFCAAATAAICRVRYGGADRICEHVIDPILQSPAVEAEKMYARYMALLPKLDEPGTNPELVEILTTITNTPKATIIRLFTQREQDRYETVATNATATWRFDIPAYASGRELAVRMKFAGDFNLRGEVRGDFQLGEFCGSVSNVTKSAVRVPLAAQDPAAASSFAGGVSTLSFANTGPNTLMMRPRRDLKILVAADSFWANLVRAYIQLVSMLAAIIAFAVLLGACLGRTVAVFSCIVLIFVGAASSDIILSYPDQLESDRIDRISLAITRTVAMASRPLSSLNPVARLAGDECIEPSQTALVVALDGVAIPFAFALLCAFAISRSREF